jgi:CRP-like cAMP-binding protein
VATVGFEGFVGLPAYFGTGRSPARVYCQVPPCVCRRMDADAFREELGRGGPFADLLARYVQSAVNQAFQSVACGRLHSVEERLGRWLLMTHDRVGAEHFTLTQQVLSEMLGVRRASVTLAAGAFQKAGLIEYTRGRITLLDRPGLEAAACECYAITRAETERLLGPVLGPTGPVG